MKGLLLAALVLAGCAPSVPPYYPDPLVRVIPSGSPPEMLQPGFEPVAVANNLLMSARDRFGESAVRRALSAPAYLFAKHFPGMLPPLPPGASPPPIPTAMLMREGDRWVAATPDGFRSVLRDKSEAIDAILADRAFWASPDYAPPNCTDAGASLLLVKLPGRPETARRGACGPSQRTEQLAMLALEG